ncbi:uncharacterized protein ACMZJ9_010183 [Mantella aurantiaca]
MSECFNTKLHGGKVLRKRNLEIKKGIKNTYPLDAGGCQWALLMTQREITQHEAQVTDKPKYGKLGMGGGCNYQFPVALNWDQGPEKLTKLKNKLQLYFGSKSKSDGGECEIQDSDCSQGYILIHFKEEAARDRVLQRKTQKLKLPNGETLHLEVRSSEHIQSTENPLPPQDEAAACKTEKDCKLETGKPTPEKEEASPSCLSSLVLLENVQESCIPEILNLMVENVSNKSMDMDFHIERIPEIQSAVITFTCDIDTVNFIGKFSSHLRVKQQKITAKSLEESRSIRVEGIPPNTTEMMVLLYFESAKNGGGRVEDTVMLSDEDAALVTFHQAGVLKIVMTRQHVLNNKAIYVYPYYPSIGHCLYGKEGPHILLPDSVEIPISSHILAFIWKDEDTKVNVEKAMADVYCDITWPNLDHPTPVIKLSLTRTLSSHLRTLAKIVPAWSNNVHKECELFISKYKAIECDLKPPVWEAIKEKMSSSSYDEVLIEPDLAAEKAFIAGIAEDVTKIEPIFRKLVEETTRQLSRVEDDVPLEPEEYKLMFAQGLEKSILDNCPQVKISYDETSKTVKLYGPKEEVLTAKCEILSNKHDLKQKSIQLDPDMIQLLKEEDNGELPDLPMLQKDDHELGGHEELSVVSALWPYSVIAERTSRSQGHKDCIATQSGNLRCKKILHMVGTNSASAIKSFIAGALTECAQLQATSVAFPAIGTGVGSVPSSVVADTILESVADFAKSPKSVQTVKVVIFQKQMLNDFYTSMKKKEGGNLPKQEGIFIKIKNSLLSMFSLNAEGSGEFKVLEFKENIEPAIFQLCAERQDDLNKTKDWLRNLILKEQYENIITDDWIQDLKPEALEKLQKEYQVALIFDASNSEIKVLGLSRDVLEVSNKIQDIIMVVRDKKTRERKAELCSNLVEWGYFSGGNLIAFDKMTNMELEKAKNEDRQSLSIDINGVKYTVIVERLCARDPRGNTVKIQRKSKHEKLDVPDDWAPMNNDNMKEVQLAAGSPEFTKVEKEFRKTCNMQIVKMERIQNRHLWINYQIKKQSIDDKNGSTNSEKQLFHGVDANTVSSVNCNGFNRSYAGKNEAYYGNGTYFSVNASYSARDTYSRPDGKAYKYMYLSRVVTGVSCPGRQGMNAPPPKNPSNPTDLYDSVTDNVSNPVMYVIFHDIQAYPEYLITFTK